MKEKVSLVVRQWVCALGKRLSALEVSSLDVLEETLAFGGEEDFSYKFKQDQITKRCAKIKFSESGMLDGYIRKFCMVFLEFCSVFPFSFVGEKSFISFEKTFSG